ncbi:MAG: winged helix-turn-helix transcriptional regulator [Proteobacteria bacterium]|nr:winged helix-turn-helix transcriptional regulator [Pseudomonadota bacterium]
MSDAASFTSELIAICRLVGAFERDSICCGTVTVPQCVALQDLLDGPRTVQELAAVAGVTSSATTRLVDGLAKRGWAERRRDTDDRRKVFIALTQSGNEEAERLRDLTADAASAILARIPRGRHAEVLRALAEVRAAVAEARLAGSVSCC